MQDGCSQASADADSTAAQPGVSIAAAGHALRMRLRHWLMLERFSACCSWQAALAAYAFLRK